MRILFSLFPDFDPKGLDNGGLWVRIHPPGLMGAKIIFCPFGTGKATTTCGAVFGRA
jgi:hypothetical protein